MRILVLFFLVINLYAKDILGEIDKFDLPLLNLNSISARIDTGATSSSIHCTNIEKVEDNYIKFKLLGKYDFSSPIYKTAFIKSSNGQIQKRYFIKTQIKIFNKLYPIELSLNDRKNMTYPILIGRDILKEGFIVDVSKQNLSFKMR